MMKWIFLSSLLSSLSKAFLVSTNLKKSPSALFFYPENYDRAVECATHYGTCNLNELEQLADELEQFQSNEFGGLLQTKDHHMDTSQVKTMLLVQSKLMHMTDDFVGEHHKPDTFDMSEVF